MNNNMNDAPTKEELLAAGFKLEDEFTALVSYPLQGESSIDMHYLNHSGRKYMLKDGDWKVLLPIPFTKQALFDFVKLSNGKELDFTVKEKTYSWVEVFSSLDSSLKMSIHNVLLTIASSILPEKLKKKLTALVKLEYIIKAIEADFEPNADGDSCPIYFFPSDNKIDYDYLTDSNLKSTISTNSGEAAKKLIKHHPDLIKDALGVLRLI